VKRVIVLGGLGQFGRAAAAELRRRGAAVQIAARGAGGDLNVDANDPAAIRSALRSGDVVVDAAGPFHARSMALVEAAIDTGFDLIDINDNLQFAEAVLALAPRIKRAGIRVLSSASTVAAVAAAVIRHCGIVRPRSIVAFLVPASRRTANVGTALSLIRCVGQPVRVFCDGRFHEFQGWSQALNFRMPWPVGAIRGRLFESADAAYLPRIWPSLRDVTMYVDTNTPGGNAALRIAARWPAVRSFLQRQVRWSVRFARIFGSSAGGIGYQIEGDGRIAQCAIVSSKNSFLTAIAPAVLAGQAIAEDRVPERGLVLPDRHVEPAELFAFLHSAGITLDCSWPL
jgi:hypothetical protein